MDDESGVRQQLSERIKARRANISRFLSRTRPRRNRLANLSIVGSAIAAVMTAGPALGGQSFTASVQSRLGIEDSSTVWRVLCLIAMLLSVAAAVATNLSNSRDLNGRVTAAETCNAELEGLETMLEFGQLPLQDAVKLYQQYVAKVPFVDEVTVPG
ncbi:hypothetical protein [Paeniglutamicibacter kerguelensis]|uniref:MFS family permease n=1 Tax=Paeniglutamicibacter kerguelensis TaxID=254788 RepID=A0ABS4XCD5_9MICC|nr:hypothetical protein [Paeniglutamicibacter kerguelensis]MBP2385898.1 MFS family permease [Paeniglutamicibacter kerguelensis]